MQILGVRPAANVAWLAIIDQEQVIPEPDRFELSNEPRPAALIGGLERAEILLKEHGIAAVAVLDAQGIAKPDSYQAARKRLTLESLLEIAAARADVSYILMSPQAVQGALQLPTRRIEDHVDSVVAKAGTRWNERGPAAVAAIAAIRLNGE